MNLSISSIIQQLEVYIQKAHQSGNKYDFIDPAYELCQELEALDDPAQAIEPLFLLIERSPDIDYGGPGPLGQFLESFEGGIYEEQLMQSLQRKPTVYTINLMDILLLDSNDPQQIRYLGIIQAISFDHSQPEHIREEAADSLEYAFENLYGGDEKPELQKQFNDMDTLFEQISAQEAEQRQALQNHEPPPPVPTVTYEGILFKVITRKQAQAYLPNITDLPGLDGPLYDVWDEWRFPTWLEHAYFLLAEENVTTEKLELDYGIPEIEGIDFLGFIFLKNLEVQSYILAYDTDNSPALIVHGDVQSPCIHLFGNIHYIGGQVTTDLLWAKYNHGELFLNGSIEAKVILADNMSVFIRSISKTVALISIMGMNIYLKTGSEWPQVPATHDIADVFIPEVCITDEEGEIVLREEGPDSAVDLITQNKPLLK